jgi:hypothetical protein
MANKGMAKSCESLKPGIESEEKKKAGIAPVEFSYSQNSQGGLTMYHSIYKSAIL